MYRLNFNGAGKNLPHAQCLTRRSQSFLQKQDESGKISLTNRLFLMEWKKTQKKFW
jgi:hypothetical protein